MFLRFLKGVPCLLLFLFTILLAGCNSLGITNQLPVSKPKDFNFIFNYGVNAKNQLDTVKGQFTKDMIREPSITVKLELSDEEMNAIYSEMKKIDILNYPESFNPKSNRILSPYQTYSIKIIADGREKSIYWKDESVSKTKKAVQLRELFNKIKEMIINKEEYKKLPTPKGGYI